MLLDDSLRIAARSNYGAHWGLSRRAELCLLGLSLLSLWAASSLYSAPPGAPKGAAKEPLEADESPESLAALEQKIVAAAVIVFPGRAARALTPGESLGAAEREPANSRQAKAYVATMLGEKPDAPAAHEMKVYWDASGKIRFENYHEEKVFRTAVFSTSGPGIVIDHEAQTYSTRLRVTGDRNLRWAFLRLEELGRFAGQADRGLGTRQIADRPARGFEITMGKVDPDFGPGTLRVWVDQKSGLPIEVECEVERDGGEMHTFRLKDIRWHDQLDAHLFDAQAPAGYAELRRPQLPEDEQVTVSRIVTALRIYSEFFGGRYPQVTRVYPDALHNQLSKKVGIRRAASSAQIRSGQPLKVGKAVAGFGCLSIILRHNADAAYYGKTVGPQDKDKVLARWRLDDGKYQVIYGDLRAEEVTAEKLRQMEHGPSQRRQGQGSGA